MTFLTPSTANEYAVIDSFHLAEGICLQDPSLHMTSLDVDSLFTKIPPDKTIATKATNESFFMLNNKYYKQVDCAAMGSPLGLALANIFMCSFESKWLRDCPNDFKPVFYRRYVDEIFVLFSSPDHADKFK